MEDFEKALRNYDKPDRDAIIKFIGYMPEHVRLIASGYRAVSNKYRMVARIDRPDWREAMADYQTGGFPGDKAKNRADGMRWVMGLGSGAADFYRRVISKDVLEYVDHDVFQAIRAAGPYGWGDCDEYLELIPKGDE